MLRGVLLFVDTILYSVFASFVTTQGSGGVADSHLPKYKTILFWDNSSGIHHVEPSSLGFMDAGKLWCRIFVDLNSKGIEIIVIIPAPTGGCIRDGVSDEIPNDLFISFLVFIQFLWPLLSGWQRFNRISFIQLRRVQVTDYI